MGVCECECMWVCMYVCCHYNSNNNDYSNNDNKNNNNDSNNDNSNNNINYTNSKRGFFISLFSYVVLTGNDRQKNMVKSDVALQYETSVIGTKQNIKIFNITYQVLVC